MDDAKFDEISKRGVGMIRSALTVPSDVAGGQVIAYNAWFRDVEVAVLGFQMPRDGGGTWTKPLAILISPEVFDELEVEGEKDRMDGQGNVAPANIRGGP